MNEMITYDPDDTRLTSAEPESSLLSLLPGRKRAERRFVRHCLRMELRGTLSRFKRTRLNRLMAELAR